MIKRTLGSWITRWAVNSKLDLFGIWRRITRAPNWRLVRPEIKVRQLSREDAQVFFGYYDVSPFNADSRFLLACHAPPGAREPQPNEEIQTGFYEWREDPPQFVPLGVTSAWCWQQGCRLQWYPKPRRNWALYNRMVEDDYGCVVQDIGSRQIERMFRRPVYALTPDGRWGLSLNFSRLHRMRPGYGYVNLPDETAGRPAPDDDGIWRIDMETGEEKLILALDELARFQPVEGMEGAEHYVNHIMVNPSSSRFMFFHLWVKRGKRRGRLITCGLEGHKRFILNNEGHVSHCNWKNDGEIIAYSTHADTGTHFYLYQDQTHERSIVGRGVLTRDSHPSYSPDGELLLLDSYPDGFREQHLCVFDTRKGALRELGRFYAPVAFDETRVRCDLHPRWSPCGRHICVDSVCGGTRSMFVLDVDLERMANRKAAI